MGKSFIYLASASPRRAELLRQLGVEYRVHPAEIDERRLGAEPAVAYVKRIAAAKAVAVRARVGPEVPVLGADTVVVCDGQVLGKPDGAATALDMLERLSGRTHDVLSAVAVADAQSAPTLLSISKVRFRPTTVGERAAYCATHEPLDKAGAYGIQGFAAAFVEHLDGSYSGVMGLPLCETAELLAPFGLPRWLHGNGTDPRDES
ncbi:MAG: Maf family protein [Gammaproteobacteria bacterium]|jgi:septum formation protein